MRQAVGLIGALSTADGRGIGFDRSPFNSAGERHWVRLQLFSTAHGRGIGFDLSPLHIARGRQRVLAQLFEQRQGEAEAGDVRLGAAEDRSDEVEWGKMKHKRVGKRDARRKRGRQDRRRGAQD